MPYDTSQLEKLGYKPSETPPENNSPNENLMLVQEVQGLVSQIWDKIKTIEPKTDRQKVILSMAGDEINLYERTTLNELQEAFE